MADAYKALRIGDFLAGLGNRQSSYKLAGIYARAGDTDRAFTLLEESFAQ